MSDHSNGFSSPNYTQVPNDLFEMMADMTFAEVKVILCLVRYTFGYHRQSVTASYRILAEHTGLSKQGVIDGCKALEERGLIKKVETSNDGTVWEMVIDDRQKSRECPTELTRGGQPSRTGGVNPVGQLKETKEIKKKSVLGEIEQTTSTIVQPTTPAKLSEDPSLSADDREFWKAKEDEQNQRRQEKNGMGGGNDRPRSATDYVQSVKRTADQAMVTGGIDLASYPEDVRPVISRLCYLWQLIPPSKRVRASRSGEFADWVAGAREIIDACGEFDPSAVMDEFHKRWMVSDSPFRVGRPGALVRSLRATAAEMRGKQEQLPLTDADGNPVFYG